MGHREEEAGQPGGSGRDATQAYEQALTAQLPAVELVLYVAGTSSHSVHAIRNTRNLCEAHLRGRYSLEVIDVYQQPALLAEVEIVAVPTLVKKSPPPLQRFVGDLSDGQKFLAAVGALPVRPEVGER